MAVIARQAAIAGVEGLARHVATLGFLTLNLGIWSIHHKQTFSNSESSPLSKAFATEILISQSR